MRRESFYFDPTADGTAVFLGRSESLLMELAWKHGVLTVKQALFYLSERRPAYTTVMTILTRLATKGLLAREREGRNFVYRPCQSREQFVRARVGAVLACLRRNYPEALGTR